MNFVINYVVNKVAEKVLFTGLTYAAVYTAGKTLPMIVDPVWAIELKKYYFGGSQCINFL